MILYLPEDGKGVRIPDPARDDVHVQMVLYACAGGPSQIHSQVEALGIQGLLEHFDAAGRQVKHLAVLFETEFLDVADMPVRRHHEMARDVRIAIHDDEGVHAVMEHKLVVPDGIPAENATFHLLPPDVFHSPWRIEAFHVIPMSALPDQPSSTAMILPAIPPSPISRIPTVLEPA